MPKLEQQRRKRNYRKRWRSWHATSDQPTTTPDLQDYLQCIRALHGRAYDWEPPPVGSAPYPTSTSMREYIRWWIAEWDLKRLFPGYEPQIEVTPFEFDYSEDADLERLADEPSAGAANWERTPESLTG